MFGLAVLTITASETGGRAKKPIPEPTSVNRDGCNAEQLSADALELRNTWQASNLKQAILTYEQALSCAQAANSLQSEARALRGIANILDILGDRENACQYYGKALQRFVSLHDRRGEAETLIELSFAYSRGSSGQKSLKESIRALRIARELGDKHTQSLALNSLGFAYYVLGEPIAAEKNFTEALDFARSSDGDHPIRAHVLVHLGYIYIDRGNLKDSLAAYEEAISLCQSVKQPWIEARALSGIGGIYTLWGESQKALEYHQRALELQQRIGDKEGQAVTLNGMGYSYEQLGDNEKALHAYTQALELFRTTGNSDGQSFTVQYVGNIHARLGHKESAESYYLEGLTLSRKFLDNISEAFVLNNLGALYQSAGDSRKALRNYQQALAIYNRTRNRRGTAYTLNNVGYALTTLGKLDQALSYHRRALTLIRAAGDRQEESLILYDIARAQNRQGKLEEARAALAEAIGITESLRTNVISQDFRASYFSTVRPHYELYIDVLMQLHKQRPNGELQAEAFAVSERAHARSLLESLKEARADIRQGVDPELLKAEASLRQTLTTKAERQIQLLSSNNRQEAEAVASEINELSSQYDQLKTRIKSASPRYAALVLPQPLTLREIQQQVLDEDSLLLEYTLGDDRSYLWAVAREGVWSYELPSRSEIEQAARSLYGLLTANHPIAAETFEQQQARMEAAALQLPPQIAYMSKLLLAPVASRLGTKRLLIVPDGALQYVPFQILNAGNDSRPLVADHEIVNEHSASTLALLTTEMKSRNAPSRSVAVLADPVFEADDPRIASAGKSTAVSTALVQETELHRAMRDVNLSGAGNQIPRLLASQDEAEAIMSVTPWRSGFKAMGFEASRATAMSTGLNDFRIVHFATHGLLNNEHPDLSGIVLSLFDQKGQPQDGFLRLHDIYNLKLNVDLVVLSACNTGLGKDVRGEGLIGLTRGFMYAGALSVIASLWKVDDEATAELMRLFYGYMLGDGLSPAAALRKAQVTMSQQKRWQSPYYWAGFVIQGQYNQLERTNRFPTTQLALWLFGAAAISAASFYILKRRRKQIV